MKSGYSHISFVLDRSGSMGYIQDDTIGGVNKFIEDQQALEGECTFTLCQFDDKYEIDYSFKNIKEVEKLTRATFQPRGWTAMYDAIGRQIVETGEKLASLPEDQRPEKVLFVILTDGQENSSKEFVRTKINEMIKHQNETYQWEFIFLGANIDAESVGTTLGIKAGNSMTFACNSTSVADSFGTMSKSVGGYRGMSVEAYASAALSDDYESFTSADKLRQKQAGA